MEKRKHTAASPALKRHLAAARKKTTRCDTCGAFIRRGATECPNGHAQKKRRTSLTAARKVTVVVK